MEKNTTINATYYFIKSGKLFINVSKRRYDDIKTNFEKCKKNYKENINKQKEKNGVSMTEYILKI